MKFIYFLLTIFVSFSLAAAAANAQVINAASCNESDVQAALKQASNGYAAPVVVIPNGNCTWTAPLSYTAPPNLTIEGQTVCTGSGDPAYNNLSCTDNTILTDGMSYSSTDPEMLSITTTSGTFRLTGLSITGAGSSIQTYNGALGIFGTSQDIRVDHDHLYNVNARIFETSGSLSGVFDHDVIQGAAGAGWATDGGTSTDPFGDYSWAEPTQLGTNNFIIFEDDLFLNGGNDCYSGGRWVIRFSTFVQKQGTGFVQTHPTGGSGRDRGCRAWELYGNTFTDSQGPAYNVFFLSSGTGVLWGNRATDGTVENFVTLHSMRRDNSTYPEVPPPNGWGYCGTSYNGTGSAWDQNQNPSTGYHCLDQPGMGQSDLLSGDFPHVCDATTGCTTYNGTWPHQQLEPIYEWDDSFTPASGYNGSFWKISDADSFVANSDYYLWCNSSSPTGCTSFNGTQGVGSGTLANRPTTCTPGVGYWATDQGNWNKSANGFGQGELYVCTATNTWTLHYVPYMYPDPLDTTTISLTGTVTAQ